jgi:hypothetical protein
MTGIVLGINSMSAHPSIYTRGWPIEIIASVNNIYPDEGELCGAFPFRTETIFERQG